MKLSEAKSIGKKITCAVLCVALLLIFTSASYGALNPKYKYRVKADPWEHVEKAPKQNDDQSLDLILVVIGPDVCLVFKFQFNMENSRNLDELTNQRSNSPAKLDFLDKSERKFQK